MKAATPTLSAEQKRASEKYQLVFGPGIMVFSIVGFCAIEILLFAFVRVFHIHIGPRSNPSSATVVVAFFAAHYWAIRKVREAGLSLESRKVEVLADRKTDFRGEVKEWWHPKTLSASLGIAVVYFGFSLGSWGLIQLTRPSIIDRWTGIIGFWLFLWWGVFTVIFARSPRLRFDDNGIVLLQNGWRRQLRWNRVARCEIQTSFDYMGRGPTRVFLFRDVAEKVLLRLAPAHIGLSIDEQAEIEAEIRRRFAAVETTSDETLTT